MKTLGVMALGMVVLALCVVFLQYGTTESNSAKIHMLNIGQGDSFLIQAANGTQLLIDGGRDATVLSELAKVMPAGDRSIDIVIATHPDADHIGGLDDVFKRYQVGMFMTSQVQGDTAEYKGLMQAVANEHIPAYYARHGSVLTLDDGATTNLPASFVILFPDRDTTDWETNTASVVGRLQIGTGANMRSALFTGDSPISIEQYLRIAQPTAIDVDILKLGHHGSRTSSSYAFLKAATPTLALISAGVHNSYGHPHQEVLTALKDLSIPYVSTQDKGTVTLSTDGSTWMETDEQ